MNMYSQNELITYGLLAAYIAFHPTIPSQLKPIVSHPIMKFIVAASIVYFSRINTTYAILIALVYITTYLSCITMEEKFSGSDSCFNDCMKHKVHNTEIMSYNIKNTTECKKQCNI